MGFYSRKFVEASDWEWFAESAGIVPVVLGTLEEEVRLATQKTKV